MRHRDRLDGRWRPAWFIGLFVAAALVVSLLVDGADERRVTLPGRAVAAPVGADLEPALRPAAGAPERGSHARGAADVTAPRRSFAGAFAAWLEDASEHDDGALVHDGPLRDRIVGELKQLRTGYNDTILADIDATGREPSFEAKLEASARRARSSDDFVGAYLDALLLTSRSPIAVILAEEVIGIMPDARTPDAVVRYLERAVHADDATELLYRGFALHVMFILDRHGRSPEVAWRLAAESGDWDLGVHSAMWLSLFPTEEIEHLLLEGLAHESGGIRFGTMEAIRRLGTRGRIDTRLYAEKLAQVVRSHPRTSRLHLEAIDELGHADPFLLDFVESAPSETLRRDAAAYCVMSFAPERAVALLREWAARPSTRAIALGAVGVLPGEAGDALLREWFDDARDADERRALLSAMAGRATCFEQAIAAGLRDEAADVREAALASLLYGRLAETSTAELAGSSDLAHVVAGDPSPEVRSLAAIGLALDRNDTALLTALETDEDASVRATAGVALALAAGRDGEARNRIFEARARETNPVVRAALDEVCGLLDDETAVDAVRSQITAQLGVTRGAAETIDTEGMAKNPLAVSVAIDEWLLERLGPGADDTTDRY